MTKAEREKIIAQVRLENGASRVVALELGLPQIFSNVWKTSKKDQNSRKKVPNTIKIY